MRIIRLSFVLLLLPLTHLLYAEDVLIKNVHSEKKGEYIFIYYDLDGNPEKRHRVSMVISDDSSQTYSPQPSSIEGDIGSSIYTGQGKKVIWHYTEDFPIIHDRGDFVFSFHAELQKSRSKWPYAVGAVIVGGVIYFLTADHKSNEPAPSTTGSISILVPVDF